MQYRGNAQHGPQADPPHAPVRPEPAADHPQALDQHADLKSAAKQDRQSAFFLIHAQNQLACQRPGSRIADRFNAAVKKSPRRFPGAYDLNGFGKHTAVKLFPQRPGFRVKTIERIIFLKRTAFPFDLDLIV